MKSSRPVVSAKITVLAAALLATAPLASGQLPNEAVASVAPGTAANTVNVTVTDPGNRVWKLQSSADFQTWTDVATVKVHNGHFQRALSHSPAASALFFRHFYASTEPDIPSTAANALRLPASPFDAGVPINFTNFTAQENQGRQIFNGAGNCAACHGSNNFVPGNAINNNGLENPYLDKGVGALTGRPQDEGLFKVPSLRNIELTAPYMHDGRFATLEEVVEFYNSGVVNHPNLSPPLRNPPPGPPTPRRLNLTAAQKAALVAFLKTLTDTSVTTDAKFSDPFNYGD